MDDDKYNGWTNWETWNTHLWMTNDPGTYEAAREIVKDATPPAISATADPFHVAAVALREWWDESEWAGAIDTDYTGPMADAWTAHLDRVNWREIVEALAEE